MINLANENLIVIDEAGFDAAETDRDLIAERLNKDAVNYHYNYFTVKFVRDRHIKTLRNVTFNRPVRTKRSRSSYNSGYGKVNYYYYS